LEDVATEAEDVDTLILASGKIIYDIRQALSRRGRSDVQLIRIEQFYPFPVEELRAGIGKYRNAKRYIWVQEEPRNLGAFMFMRNTFGDEFGIDLSYAGRPAAASSATGSSRRYAAEQQQVVADLVHFLDH